MSPAHDARCYMCREPCRAAPPRAFPRCERCRELARQLHERPRDALACVCGQWRLPGERFPTCAAAEAARPTIPPPPPPPAQAAAPVRCPRCGTATRPDAFCGRCGDFQMPAEGDA